jgi:hypothetical protein
MNFTAENFTLKVTDKQTFQLKIKDEFKRRNIPSEFGINRNMPYVIYNDGTMCQGMGVTHSSVKEWGATLLSVDHFDFRPDTIRFSDNTEIKLPGIFKYPR